VALVSQPGQSALQDHPLGGIPNWDYQIARRLAPHCDVTVYAGHAGWRIREQMEQGVRYRSVPARGFVRGLRALAPLLASPRRPVHSSPAYGLMYAAGVALDLRRRGCDIVHVHNYSQFIPIIRTLNPAAKTVLHMHCSWLTQLDPGMVRRRLRATDLVLGVSRYLIEAIARKFPEFESRCRVIPNGVDLEQFAPAEPRTDHSDSLTLVYAGRISPEKGLHVLLEALRAVVAQHSGVRLVIAGGKSSTAPRDFIVDLSQDPVVRDLGRFYQGDYFTHLRQSLMPQLSSHVTFVGQIPHPELASLLRRCDLFVHPVVCDEALGNAVREAMAAGLPVIATYTGGLAESVDDGCTGLLVEPNDAAGLAKAILRLASDGVLRRAMGVAARQRVSERFSWDRVGDHTLNEYRGLMGRVTGSDRVTWGPEDPAL
jgi:glycosyltransferase involved in cell wall biosynthesis